MPKKNPSQQRELALAEIAQRLGHTKDQDERYNNGYAHHSLAPHSAFIRATEQRLASFVSSLHVTVLEAVPLKKENQGKAENLAGKTILVNRGIFITGRDDLPLTAWIENFYQESPSINARAREDQVELGTKGFAVPVIAPYMTGMEEMD